MIVSLDASVTVVVAAVVAAAKDADANDAAGWNDAGGKMVVTMMTMIKLTTTTMT